MGTPTDHHNSGHHGADIASSRVADHRSFDLHRILIKTGKFFLPTLVFLIGLELVFRFLNLPPYGHYQARFMYVESPEANFVLNPGYSGKLSNLEYLNQIKVDKFGFRDKRSSDVKLDPGKTHLLFLGDSMTFGQGVEYGQSFAGLFSNLDEFQSFNAGVPSYGTMHSLGLLKNIGQRVSPKIVVYAIYPGNDFYDNTRGFIKHVVGGYLTDDKDLDVSKVKEGNVDYSVYSERAYLNPFDRLLVKTSKIYQYFRFRALFIPYFKDLYMSKGITDSAKCSLAFSISPYEVGFVNEPEYKRTMDLILKMRDYVEQDLKAEFILLLVPTKEQVNTGLWEYEKKLGCFDANSVDLYNPNKFLKQFSESNHIRFVDTTEALKDSFNNQQNPYYKIDSHINQLGHEIIFKQLYNTLAQEEK